MKIAIVGGGHGSYAAAADLAEQGHRVSMWRRDAEQFQATLDAQAIDLKDYAGIRTIPLALASTDLADVVAGAQLIVVALPAFAQASVAEQLAPHLSDGQVIFLTPGTFGSYVMAKRLQEAGCTAKVAFAETGTLPYLARKHGPNTVAVSGRATRLPAGVFPSERAEEAYDVLRQAFPAVERLQDALDGALMNAGPIIHPPLILMNAGPIEYFDHWDIHNEGTQPSIRKVHDALDAERIAIREALGYGAPHFPLSDHYNPDGDEWMYGRRAHEKLVDSADWREHLELYSHRYMQEDVACGLAFLVSLADWLDVPAPVASGLLAIASAVTGKHLRAAGRTLESLGLDRLTPVEMKELLRSGCAIGEVPA